MTAQDLAEFLSEDTLQSLKEENILHIALWDFFNTLLEQESYILDIKKKKIQPDNKLLDTFYGIADIEIYMEYILPRYGGKSSLHRSGKVDAFASLDHQYNGLKEHNAKALKKEDVI